MLKSCSESYLKVNSVSLIVKDVIAATTFFYYWLFSPPTHQHLTSSLPRILPLTLTSPPSRLTSLSCKGVSMAKSYNQSSSLLFDAYMVRAEALSGLGSTEQVRERERK